VLCAAGELALLVRQNGLASAIFNQILLNNPSTLAARSGSRIGV